MTQGDESDVAGVGANPPAAGPHEVAQQLAREARGLVLTLRFQLAHAALSRMGGS